MTAQIRPGFQTVSSYLAVQGATSLVEFLCSAFGAEHTFRSPNGTHFEIRIGDAMVMIGEVGDERPPSTGQLFMYVSDPDELHKRAIAAGATSVMEPTMRDSNAHPTNARMPPRSGRVNGCAVLRCAAALRVTHPARCGRMTVKGRRVPPARLTPDRPGTRPPARERSPVGAARCEAKPARWREARREARSRRG